MDTATQIKKAIADRKASQVNTLKRLDTAVKESKANRHRRMAEQRQTE